MSLAIPILNVRKSVGFQQFGWQPYSIDTPDGQITCHVQQHWFGLKKFTVQAVGRNNPDLYFSMIVRSRALLGLTDDILDMPTNTCIGSLRRRLIGWDRFDILDNTNTPIGKFSLKKLSLTKTQYHVYLHEQLVCVMTMTYQLLSSYSVELDFSPDAEGVFDPRMGIAAALTILRNQGSRNNGGSGL